MKKELYSRYGRLTFEFSSYKKGKSADRQMVERLEVKSTVKNALLLVKYGIPKGTKMTQLILHVKLLRKCNVKSQKLMTMKTLSADALVVGYSKFAQ